MARKTNKTDHVLSLLSGAEAAAEKEEKKKPEHEQDSRGSNSMDSANNVESAVSKVTHQGNVHVVLAKGREGDPVAEIVKEKLQEELERQEENDRREEREVQEENERQKEQPDGEAAVEAPAEPPEPEPEKPEEPVLEEPEEMDGYVFYNIMERIVQDKAMKYMKQFGNCTCKRCEADTIALALSKLPPKYVVVKEDSVSPLINFYEDHFAGQIIVEITKACIVVNKNPRHNIKEP